MTSACVSETSLRELTEVDVSPRTWLIFKSGWLFFFFPVGVFVFLFSSRGFLFVFSKSDLTGALFSGPCLLLTVKWRRMLKER